MSSHSLKVVCVLYADPIKGYPSIYPRDELPKIDNYPDGQIVPTPSNIDFTPGVLLGSVSGELGLRTFIERLGHKLVVTSDKDGDGSTFDKELVDADIVISQPFWPAYLTSDRISRATNLKLAITAGIGSDHIDLDSAVKSKMTVAEITYSNSISVSEHAVMMILSLVRNFIPQYLQVVNGGWNIADCVARSYDVEGMQVGVIGAGRIGIAVLKRLYPFDVKLHYTDQYRLPEHIENEFKLTYHSNLNSILSSCDVISIHCPLHGETEHLFDEKVLKMMKKGSYLINTARGKICDTQAVKKALETGHLAGYAGDVWFPQPAPKDHPWRTMMHHAMTPHTSGTSLAAQARYAAGVREILECYFEGRSIRNEYLIVKDGKLAGAGAHSYKKGNTTSGSAI